MQNNKWLSRKFIGAMVLTILLFIDNMWGTGLAEQSDTFVNAIMLIVNAIPMTTYIVTEAANDKKSIEQTNGSAK